MVSKINLFDQYILDASEDGLVIGLAQLMFDAEKGIVSLNDLEREFPNGPINVLDTFVSKYPDVQLSPLSILDERIGVHLNDLYLDEIFQNEPDMFA